MFKNNFIPVFCMNEAGEGGDAGGRSTQTVTTNAGDGNASVTVGDVAKGSQEDSSATATVNGFGQSDPAEGQDDFRTQLGELAGNPSLKDVKDVKGLAKMYIDTKQMVGKNSGPLPEDASDEEKAAFYKALGVPEEGTPDAYGLTTEAPEEWPEDLPYNPEHASAFAEKAKELNLSAEQAKDLQQWYDGFTKEQFEAVGAQNAEREGQFDQMAEKIYGENRLKAMDNARALISKYVPKELAESMADWPNSQLLAFASFTSNFTKETTGEDQLVNGQAGGGSDPVALKNEMEEIMRSDEYRNPFAKGKEAHEAAKSRVREISKQINMVRS